GGLKEGSRINNPRAAEVGHMFLANAFAGQGLFGLLATHPPLADRIRAIDPQFDGQFPAVRPVGIDRDELHRPPPGRSPPTSGLPRYPGMPQVPPPVLGLANEAAARVGQINPEEINLAQTLYASIPGALRVAAQEPFSARALIYALLL